ncbi:Coiled-coil domain-containing protein 47, partial [Spiromyces aspiralis]
MVSARLTAPFATSMAVPPLLLFLMALGQIPSVLGEELEAVKPSDPTTTATSDPAAPGAKSPLPPLHWSDFKLELLLVAALVTYVANYFYGSSKNAEEARLWEIPINNKLKENFQRIGPPSSGGQQQVLEYDGPADRLFWATGRRYCKVIQGHLQ